MAEEATAAMATLEVAPDHKLPPARVRALWKKLDPDGAGGVTLEALEAGFAKDFKVDKMGPTVLEAMKGNFEKHSVDGKLPRKVFSRFYCEVLFYHVDADKNGTLELAEFQNALKHMVKPNEKGEQVMPIIAYPPDLKDDKGEVHLPLPWFWGNFSASTPRAILRHCCTQLPRNSLTVDPSPLQWIEVSRSYSL